MAQVSCARCGSVGPGLDRAPLPGVPGESVLARTCASCWEEWKLVQVKLINEYRLNVLDPTHYERLVDEMRTFLNLEPREARPS